MKMSLENPGLDDDILLNVISDRYTQFLELTKLRFCLILQIRHVQFKATTSKESNNFKL